jgi:hypothetical protein
LLARTSFVEAMARWTPELLAEIEGIADGAAISKDDALVLNLMDELAWFSVHENNAESCSAVGIRPQGVPALVGQTMDLTESFDGSQAILQIEDTEARSLVLTSAGMVGLCGVNSDAVAIFCNQLLSLRPSVTGLPAAAVVRGALARRSFSQARAFIDSIEHASGQNYLLAGPEETVNLECSAAGVCECPSTERSVWHTNHPLASVDLAGGDDERPGFSGGSHERLSFLQERVPQASSLEDLQAIFADRSVPICKLPGPDGRELTFAAFVAQLSTPPRVWIAAGPPDRSPFSEFAFSQAGRPA